MKKYNFNSRTQHQLAIIWLLVVLFSAALLIKPFFLTDSLPIENNLLALLPTNKQDPIAQQAFDRISNEMSNKVLFVISEKDSSRNSNDEADSNDINKSNHINNSNNEPHQLLAATAEFERQLKQLELFSEVTGKIEASTQQQWAQFYYQHRWQLLTTTQQKRLTEQPETQVDYVLQMLFNPFSGVTNNELSNDPFLLFRDYLTYLNQLSYHIKPYQGYLSVIEPLSVIEQSSVIEKNRTNHHSKRYLLINAQLNGSPYSASVQQQLPLLTTLEAAIAQQYDVEILHTGVLFYAAFGTQSAQSEISTIGIGSLIGIILLVLFIFRSPLPLALSLLSITAGLLVALAGCITIFGKVHLFSLVFGASLIGVSIDYAFHFLTERLAAGTNWNSHHGLTSIFNAITLGLITSLIGYLGLLAAPFPGLQQLSLFSAIGLFGAYATVVCWYPILAASAYSHSSNRQTLLAKTSLSKIPLAQPLIGERFGQVWFALWQRPMIKVGLPLTIFLLSGIGLSFSHYNDDIHQLQALPTSLKQQEEKIARLTGINTSQEMLLVKAPSKQELLAKLASVSMQLQQWQQQGKLESYQTIVQYLPPVKEQQHNFELIKNLYKEQSSLLMKQLNLNQTPQWDHTFNPLLIDEFLQSPVAKPLRFMWLGAMGVDADNNLNTENLKTEFASVILLAKLTEQSLITNLVQSDPQVSYLNKAQEISSLFAQYRLKITELLLLTISVIYMLLCWRYGYQQALRILIPTLLAIIAGLAVTSLFGLSLNLFNLLALVLILGIGIDYTLFFAEHNRSHTTLLAITLSAITTLLSFGLLSLSQTHAIHSFGITILTGIFVAWLLAPLAILPKSADLIGYTCREQHVKKV